MQAVFSMLTCFDIRLFLNIWRKKTQQFVQLGQIIEGFNSNALVIVNLHVSFIQFQNLGEIYVNTPSTPERKQKEK